MTRNQRAKMILDAIDEHAPTCIDWNLEGIWLKAIEKGLGNIAAAENEQMKDGVPFVKYILYIYGDLEEVIWVHDCIQDSLDDLRENDEEDQIAVRCNIACYMGQLRTWYRMYEERCGDTRKDKTLADAMRGVLEWRKDNLDRDRDEISG